MKEMKILLLLILIVLLLLFEIDCFKSILHFGNTNNIFKLYSYQAKKSSKGPSEVFYCESCGVEHIRWVGRCTSCQEWNTVKSFRKPKFDPVNSLDVRSVLSNNVEKLNKQSKWLLSSNLGNSMISMDEIDLSVAINRIKFSSNEVNRVLGGGLVSGSVVLLAGEPGIGKSTLLVQLASQIAKNDKCTVVYVSGEETPEQIASRTTRLELASKGIYIITDVDVDIFIDKISQLSTLPIIIIVDSIQTMYTSSCSNSIGSVTQIRESTARLIQFAKSTGISIILVGHVTKSGDIAGPRVLEHMVDAVLNLEGNEQSDYRLLRTSKNRFGSTSEVGVFSMTSYGLKDISNPSDLFLSSTMLSDSIEGTAVAVVMEGSRPLLIEIQSLVTINYGLTSGNNKQTLRRTIEGYSMQRLLLICAVLEKHLRLNLYIFDIYINIVGGIRITEPTADLAIAVAMVSSLLSLPVVPGLALIGEIGLRGELRNGKNIDMRTSEAINLGFKTIIIPTKNSKEKVNDKSSKSLNNIYECSTLVEALNKSFNISNINELIANKKKRKKSNFVNVEQITNIDEDDDFNE